MSLRNQITINQLANDTPYRNIGFNASGVPALVIEGVNIRSAAQPAGNYYTGVYGEKSLGLAVADTVTKANDAPNNTIISVSYIVTAKGTTNPERGYRSIVTGLFYKDSAGVFTQIGATSIDVVIQSSLGTITPAFNISGGTTLQVSIGTATQDCYWFISQFVQVVDANI